MIGSSELVIVLWFLLSPLLGWAIGSRKGRPLAGLLLGLFLGFVGLIIIAVIPRAEPQRSTTAQGERGWWPDPYARHEHRFFDGSQWTGYVSNAGTQSVDVPIASGAPTPQTGAFPPPSS